MIMIKTHSKKNTGYGIEREKERKRDKQSTEIWRKQRRTFFPHEQVLVYVRKQQERERERERKADDFVNK